MVSVGRSHMLCFNFTLKKIYNCFKFWNYYFNNNTNNNSSSSSCSCCSSKSGVVVVEVTQ